ncbi:DUF2235 domain-containing protein [Corallococcus macrosporus]|uniref:DUF2235 domain-containing protein n=1 Tax=Corallococcus macrosporus TaxID=35 RepID=A0ABS3D5K3_9BACT|nr:DUF2235 domain-containing protein [Corallococcus macrosporus]MBN8226942.1 DUF2235 domain-containing protein [Corallococcus macrosporus]
MNLLSLEKGLKIRQNSGGSSLAEIAFASGGTPGADPASGLANGHMTWADDLRIPAMVEDCVHMVAAHEIRNSFPLDSVLQGLRYPKNCREMVYPGSHSDVGGGYRPGEGARSTEAGSFLSLIPLRGMRLEAIKAGVPLEAASPLPLKQKDFGEDSSSKSAFASLLSSFSHYMDCAGRGGKPVGALLLSHMKHYYQWRFRKILLNQKARGAGTLTADQTVLAAYEPVWKEERNLAKKSLLDTLPSSDGSFAKNSGIYDAQFLADALKLQQLARTYGRDNLRPHYRALLEAFEAESTGKGLKDAGIITFFDTYVHDSLAGFGGDATLPSDPRVVYTSGDNKLDYANNGKPLPRHMQSDPWVSSHST